MVDAAVADLAVMHPANHLFKGFHVSGRIAVKFHIADVAGVAQGMIRSFQTDLVVGRDRIPDRNMEAVGVILAVRDARNLSEALLVLCNELARETFSRRCEQGEVHLHFLRLLIAELTHMFDDGNALFFHLGKLAMMVAV